MSGSDLEVWLDSDLDDMRRVGTLSHDRGQVRFRYDKAWIKRARVVAEDIQMSLVRAPLTLSKAGCPGSVDIPASRWMTHSTSPSRQRSEGRTGGRHLQRTRSAARIQ